MFNKFIAGVVFAFSLVLSQAALADNQACGGAGLRAMVDSLNLDAGQKEKIKPILEQLKSSVKDNASQLMDLSKQINQQSVSANMDQSTVDSLIDKKVKMIGDMIKAKVSAKNQIFAVLNDKQKSLLQSKMKEVEDKMEAKFQSCHDQE